MLHICLICSKHFETDWTIVRKWIRKMFWLNMVPDMSFVLGVGTNRTVVATLSIANNVLVKIFRVPKKSLKLETFVRSILDFIRIGQKEFFASLEVKANSKLCNHNWWITFTFTTLKMEKLSLCVLFVYELWKPYLLWK